MDGKLQGKLGTLFVRADANSKIGTGHVMRCIALGQAWAKIGGNVVFISNCEAHSLLKRIVSEGFVFEPMSVSYPARSDHMETKRIVDNYSDGLNNDWLAIDGYHFDADYQRLVSKPEIGILAIDDNHHLPFYNADAILNPNLYGPDICYKCPPDTLLLLGGKYSLLRNEFKRWHAWQRNIPEKAKRIFVILGGGDSDNVTLKVLKALNLMNFSEATVRAVIGHANPNMASLEAVARGSSFDVELLPSVEDMPAQIAWADITITAAGQTCLELASMGAPAITIVTAENQETAAKLFAKMKIFDTMGWWHTFSTGELAEKIFAMIENRSSRKRRSERGKKAVSNLGADKGIAELLKWKTSYLRTFDEKTTW